MYEFRDFVCCAVQLIDQTVMTRSYSTQHQGLRQQVPAYYGTEGGAICGAALEPIREDSRTRGPEGTWHRVPGPPGLVHRYIIHRYLHSRYSQISSYSRKVPRTFSPRILELLTQAIKLIVYYLVICKVLVSLGRKILCSSWLRIG